LSHTDCLETPEDVERICTVLQHHRDARGRAAMITANVVFESIGGNWETKEIWRKKVAENIILSWKKAIKEQCFYPQLHAICEADQHAILNPDVKVRTGYSPYMVWDNDSNRFVDLPQELVDKSVLDGQELFNQIFGVKSLSTVPPRYLWGHAADRAFSKFGIRYVQGLRQIQNRKTSYPSHE